MANNLDKYKIKTLQYPVDLDSSPEYGGNRVLFFINVSGDGKIALKNNSAVVTDIPQGEQRKTAGRRVLEGGVSAANAISSTAASTLKSLTGAQWTPPQIEVGSPMKRLLSAISLYIPIDLTANYGVSWSEEDLMNSEANMEAVLGGLNAMTAAAKSAKALVSGNLTQATSNAGDAFVETGKALSNFVTKKLVNTLRSMPAVENATRVTPGNSKAEQLFKSVNFREFTFSYQFNPRSSEEARNVMRIVRMFRFHMLPEYKDEKEFLYIYPSEFEVRYYRGDKENEYLDKHFTAVLTQCNINYTPNGYYTTFPDGMPTQINMTLSFKELSVPTKESVGDPMSELTDPDFRATQQSGPQ